MATVGGRLVLTARAVPDPPQKYIYNGSAEKTWCLPRGLCKQMFVKACLGMLFQKVLLKQARVRSFGVDTEVAGFKKMVVLG